MQYHKLPLEAIQGIAEANEAVRRLARKKPSRTKSQQILTVRAALRARSLAYEFHDTDKIFVKPRGHRYPPFTIQFKRITIPGSPMKIELYFIECLSRQINFSTPCFTGDHMISKLVKLRLISEEESQAHLKTEKYEPYKCCKQCGERMRLNDYKCEMCGASNPQ